MVSQPFYPVNIREMAIPLGVIDPVPHDEALGDLEAYIVYPHVDKPPLSLVDESANFDRAGPQFLELVPNRLERDPGVLDILDEQKVPPRDWKLEVFGDGHPPRGLCSTAVTRGADKVDRYRNSQLPNQVGEKDKGAPENTDENQITACVVGADDRSQLPDAPGDLVAGIEENKPP